jgi:putative flavoprotein involved in K+ transport
VVGTGQSGVQIAEELHEASRRVVLSVGSAGRMPRRYRGHDIFRWLAGLAVHGDELGVSLPKEVPDKRLRFGTNPHLSGHGDGRRDVNLRRLAAEGYTLIGRINRVEGEQMMLAPDLAQNLAAADGFFDARLRVLVDKFIERAALSVPDDDRAQFAFDPPALDTFDLAAADVGSVLWTTGFALDFSWIQLPIFDEMGYPAQVRGVTAVPGLYFLGVAWQHNQGSAALFGVNEDAHHLARHMGLPEPATAWKLPIPD